MAETRWGVAAEISWVVENDGIVLVHSGMCRVIRLGYPEAALWDLLSRRTSSRRLVEMVASIAGMQTTEARDWIRRTVEQWRARGYLVTVKTDG